MTHRFLPMEVNETKDESIEYADTNDTFQIYLTRT